MKGATMLVTLQTLGIMPSQNYFVTAVWLQSGGVSRADCRKPRELSGIQVLGLGAYAPVESQRI